MDNKLFDFICIASHGSGINALIKYLQFFDVDVLVYKNNLLSSIDTFLNESCGKNMGVIVDKADISDISMNYIIKNSKNNFKLLILSRDPVRQLLSVVNTHILWWADSVAGISTTPLTSLYLYNNSNIYNLILHILNLDHMWTLPKLLHSYYHINNKTIIDISELAPQKINDTMRIINVKCDKQLDNTTSLAFNRANRFVFNVKRIYVKKNNFSFSVYPCPTVFCRLYGIYDDILYSYNKDEINFPLGNYDGTISFVCSNYNFEQLSINKNEFIKYAKNIITQNDSIIIRNYCNEISDRYEISRKLQEHFIVSCNDLINNRKLSKQIIYFIKRHLYVASKLNYNIDKIWNDSLQFLSYMCSTQ